MVTFFTFHPKFNIMFSSEALRMLFQEHNNIWSKKYEWQIDTLPSMIMYASAGSILSLQKSNDASIHNYIIITVTVYRPVFHTNVPSSHKQRGCGTRSWGIAYRIYTSFLSLLNVFKYEYLVRRNLRKWARHLDLVQCANCAQSEGSPHARLTPKFSFT